MLWLEAADQRTRCTCPQQGSSNTLLQESRLHRARRPEHDHTASLPHYPGLGYQHHLLTGRVQPKKSSSSSHPQHTSADTTTSFPPIYWPPAVFTHNSKPNPALRNSPPPGLERPPCSGWSLLLWTSSTGPSCCCWAPEQAEGHFPPHPVPTPSQTTSLPSTDHQLKLPCLSICFSASPD